MRTALHIVRGNNGRRGVWCSCPFLDARVVLVCMVAPCRQAALPAFAPRRYQVSLEAVQSLALEASPGPLSKLARWFEGAARVCVTTRHAAGVRGRATGVLAAYDRCGPQFGDHSAKR